MMKAWDDYKACVEQAMKTEFERQLDEAYQRGFRDGFMKGNTKPFDDKLKMQLEGENNNEN